MTYELAKELKDAGFPQSEAEFYYGAGYTHNDQTTYDLHHRGQQMPLRTWLEFVAAPTLSELIEACKSTFDSLSLKDGMWHAKSKEWKAHLIIAATPEEAVARLWLALNKK